MTGRYASMSTSSAFGDLVDELPGKARTGPDGVSKDEFTSRQRSDQWVSYHIIAVISGLVWAIVSDLPRSWMVELLALVVVVAGAEWLGRRSGLGSHGVWIAPWVALAVEAIASLVAMLTSGSVASHWLVTALIATAGPVWLGLRHRELRKDWEPVATVLLGAAGVLGGIVLIKFGAIQILHHRTSLGGGSIVRGLIFVGLGAFLQLKPDSLIDLLFYGFGTTRIVLGLSIIWLSGLHNMLTGLVAIVAGTAAIVAAIARRTRRDKLFGWALIAVGLATCAGAGAYWADHRVRSALSVFAIGAAAVGCGRNALLGRNLGWMLIGAGCAVAMFGWATWMDFSNSVLAVALVVFGAAVVIGGVRAIGLDKVVSTVRRIPAWLVAVRDEAGKN